VSTCTEQTENLLSPFLHVVVAGELARHAKAVWLCSSNALTAKCNVHLTHDPCKTFIFIWLQ
jgi:hypothetical protein